MDHYGENMDTMVHLVKNHTATENENKSQFITNVWRQYRRWLGSVSWARLGWVGLTLDIYEQRQQI